MKARELLLRSKQIGLEADKAAEEEKETPEEKPEEAETPEPEEKEESSEENEAADDGDSEDEAEQPESEEEESKDDESAEVEAEENDDVAETATDDSAPADTADSDDDVPADASDDEVGEETEETTVPVEGDVDSSVGDDEKEILDLNGFEVSADEAEEVIDEVSTATDALESIYINIQQSLATGGLTRQAYGFATDYANQVCKSVGLESVTTGLESADTRVQMSVAAMESIGDKIKDAGKAIAEFFRKLYEAVVERLKRFKTTIVDIAKSTADKIEQLTPEMFNQTVEVRVAQFYINGKLTRDLLGDVQKSTDNVKKFFELPLFERYDNLQDKAGQITHKTVSLDEILENLRDVNKLTHADLIKAVRFDASKDYSPADHLAGKIITGVEFVEDSNKPSAQFVLHHTQSEAAPEKISLSKLGVDKETARSLMATANSIKLAVEHYESKTMRVSARTTAAMKSADMYKNDVEFREFAKATTEIQRSVAKLIRLGSDLCTSVIDAIVELNRAVTAASKS
jgi:hypothetical protein